MHFRNFQRLRGVFRFKYIGPSSAEKGRIAPHWASEGEIIWNCKQGTPQSLVILTFYRVQFV